MMQTVEICDIESPTQLRIANRERSRQFSLRVHDDVDFVLLTSRWVVDDAGGDAPDGSAECLVRGEPGRPGATQVFEVRPRMRRENRCCALTHTLAHWMAVGAAATRDA